MKLFLGNYTKNLTLPLHRHFMKPDMLAKHCKLDNLLRGLTMTAMPSRCLIRWENNFGVIEFFFDFFNISIVILDFSLLSTSAKVLLYCIIYSSSNLKKSNLSFLLLNEIMKRKGIVHFHPVYFPVKQGMAYTCPLL